MRREVTIIGGGPAGMATAIQLKRFKLEPLLVERQALGGLLLNANLVENYLGFPNGISGPELAELFKSHFKVYNVPMLLEPVTSIEFRRKENSFFLTTKSSSFFSDIVVVATGTKAKRFDETNIFSKRVLERVFYEIHQIWELAGKRIIILGSGDAAYDYALRLSKKNDVSVISRGKTSKALPILIERVMKEKQITVCNGFRIRKAFEKNDGKLLLTFENDDKKTVDFETDYLVGAIGRVPQIDFFSADLEKNEQEFVSERKLFFAGDVKNGSLRQTAMAVGNGIETAMEIFLEKGRN